MAGDYSRNTFDPNKRYTRVLMQEGRVTLDADWNEQAENAWYRIETEAADVIGPNGAPKFGGGFALIPTKDGKDLIVSSGNMYVDGILCQAGGGFAASAQVAAGDTSAIVSNLIFDGAVLAKDDLLAFAVGAHVDLVRVTDVQTKTRQVTFAPALGAAGTAKVGRLVTYLTQPDLKPPAIPDGTWIVYLDVWECEVSALVDSDIREIALGGPDTARRLKTTWQIRLLDAGNIANCDDAAAALATATLPSSGTLNARTAPVAGDPKLCELPPSAGYRGRENQLFRVEIQKGGAIADGPTFKFAKDDASLEVSIETISGKDVIVSEIGKDDLFRFVSGQWVEIVDDASFREGRVNELRQIDNVFPAQRKITLKTNAPISSGEHLILRRWSQSSGDENGIPIQTNAWLPLDDEIEVFFSDGIYHTGDYWLIPARTAIRDILWPRFDKDTPEPQPPRGIAHHYAVLALLAAENGVRGFKRCRKVFPPLTHICAEDVCFDNGHCKLDKATTVQEAIDALCEARDLRFHNKHLHGYGIVCGLQLVCGGDATVRVRPGYALDCEGNDIILPDEKGPLDVDLTKLPEWPALSKEKQVCLTIERGAGGPEFHLLKHEQKSILDGTLLQKVLDDCLKKPAEIIKKIFEPPKDDGQPSPGVTPQQIRYTSAWNLFVQLYNHANGQKVFLSKPEHDELQKIYADLIDTADLVSDTYCALPKPGDFPAYPFDENVPERIFFGKGDHTRVRISSDGRSLFTFGTDTRISRFDWETGKLVEQIAFPVADTRVVDVAFGPAKSGGRMYAAAVGGGKGFITQFQNSKALLTEPVSPNIVTLANGFEDAEIYAVFLGEAVTTYDTKIKENSSDKLDYRGHIAIDTQSLRGYATVNADAKATPQKYDAIRLLFLGNNGLISDSASGTKLPGLGEDDLGFVFIQRDVGFLAVVLDPVVGGIQTKQLFVTNTGFKLNSMVDLGQTSTVRVAGLPPSKDAVPFAVTFSESYETRVVTSNSDAHATLQPQVIPVQICPDSITAAKSRLFVLNHASNTISALAPSVIEDPKPIDIELLIKYRQSLIDAFLGLAGILAEAIKDCFCEHLLIDCVKCTEDDRVYLGCVELADGIVRRICSLEKRKYVGTFRTINYWLSLVPIVPLIRRIFELLCCFDLPAFFAKLPPPSFPPRPCTGIGTLFDSFQTFQNVIRPMFAVDKRFTLLKNVFLSGGKPSGPAVDSTSLQNQPVENARLQLESSGVQVVAVEPFDSAKAFRDVPRALTTILPGQAVTLVERDGAVAYIHDQVSPAELGAIRGDVGRALDAAGEAKRAAVDTAAIKAQVDDVQRGLTTLEAKSVDKDALKQQIDASLAERDFRIGTLNELVKKLQTDLSQAQEVNTKAMDEITALRAQVPVIEMLKTRLDKLTPQG